MPLIRKIKRSLVGIDLPYPFFQQVKRLVEQHEGTIDEEVFAADVTILATFPDDSIEAFIHAVLELTAGSVQPVVLDDA